MKLKSYYDHFIVLHATARWESSPELPTLSGPLLPIAWPAAECVWCLSATTIRTFLDPVSTEPGTCRRQTDPLKEDLACTRAGIECEHV